MITYAEGAEAADFEDVLLIDRACSLTLAFASAIEDEVAATVDLLLDKDWEDEGTRKRDIAIAMAGRRN